MIRPVVFRGEYPIIRYEEALRGEIISRAKFDKGRPVGMIFIVDEIVDLGMDEETKAFWRELKQDPGEGDFHPRVIELRGRMMTTPLSFFYGGKNLKWGEAREIPFWNELVAVVGDTIPGIEI
jgi:hypothetical protein